MGGWIFIPDLNIMKFIVVISATYRGEYVKRKKDLILLLKICIFFPNLWLVQIKSVQRIYYQKNVTIAKNDIHKRWIEKSMQIQPGLLERT